MKPNGAPGPDGLHFSIYSSIQDTTPKYGATNTSITPKEGKELNETVGWNPITVGNI